MAGQDTLDQNSDISSDCENSENEEKINALVKTLLNSQPSPSQLSGKKKPGRPKKVKFQNDDLSMILNVVLSLRDDFKKLDQKLTNMDSRMREYMGKMKKLEQENIELKAKSVALDKRVCDLENIIEDLEQEARNNKLLVTFPKLDPAVDVITKVKETMEKELSISCEELRDVNIRKFGKRNNMALIALNKTYLKGKIFKELRLKRPKDVFVNEFLVHRREALFRQLRQYKKEGKVYSVFTLNGKIYIKYAQNEDKVLVNKIEDLRFSVN